MTFIRALLHFPVGLFSAFLMTIAPIHGVVFALGFLTYEVVEDWRINDQSFKDIFGYLVGIAVGTVGLRVFLF